MARRRPPVVHGVCVVDKHAGMTSHDVVGELRRRFGERRIGHAGTLDPDATGVLVVGVGEATRLLRFVTESRKTYTGEVVLGVETSTLDAAGDVVATHDMSSVSIDAARDAAGELTGHIAQVPPMVSARKVGGVRLHELARRGIEVPREARAVTVYRFDVAEASPGVLAIEVECSSGTYVRTLAADLGRLLGGGAHLRRLRRTRVGSFDESQAAPAARCPLLPVEVAVRSLTRVEVDVDTESAVADGAVLPTFAGDGPWAVFSAAGRLLAVYEEFRGDSAKPSVVLHAATRR